MPQEAEQSLREGKGLISLGSNATSPAGEPVATLHAALDALDNGPCRILARSRFFITPFVPAGAHPDVINAVVHVALTCPPRDFLRFLHDLEAKFGRTREQRWSNRSLDLDLLTLDQNILPDQSTLREWVNLPEQKQKTEAPDTLILPHPRMHERAFVLVPAMDVAPDWRHPLLGKTISEMVLDLPEDDVRAVRPIADGAC